MTLSEPILGAVALKYSRKIGGMKKVLYLCNTRTPKPLNDAQIGGRFIFIPMSIQFDKTYTYPIDIVALLKDRGLNVGDFQRTEHYIRNIGYYRLSAYLYPFPKKHIVTRRAAHFKKRSISTVLTKSYGCSSSMR